MEKGQIFPGISVMKILRERFNVSFEWLICNEGEMFPLETKKQGDQSGSESTLKFGENTSEVRHMLECMEKVPILKHAVLVFFLQYKYKNSEYFEEIFPEEEQKDSLDY